MKLKKNLYALAIAGACATSTYAVPNYGITFYINEVGSDVVMTSSSPNGLSLLGLTQQGSASISMSELIPNMAFLTIGTGSFTFYTSSTLTPAGIGSGGYQQSTFGLTGPLVGFGADAGGISILGVPQGYATGDPLSPSAATYTSQTLSTLGITPGTYTWTLGQNTITINAGSPSPVPEASGSVAGLGLAVAGLYQLGRRRRNTVTQ